MKKKITKFWGVGIVVILLASLFVAAAPVSAADPLKWNMEYPPSTVYNRLAPGFDIYDVASNGDTFYAVGKTYEGTVAGEAITATVTTSFTGPGNGVSENFTMTYVNQAGVGGRSATISFADNATATTAGTVTLQTGDTAVRDVTAVAISVTDTVGGAFSLTGTTSTTTYGTFAMTAALTGTYTDVSDDCVVYKSVDGGQTWVLNNDGTTYLSITSADMVAVAPDDPNIVVIVDTTTPNAFVTTTGGAIWFQMGTVGFATATAADVAISPVVLGTRYVAVAADSLWYFNLGAAAPTWTNPAVAAGGWTAPSDIPTAFYAVAFSPNFASDYIALSVSDNSAGGNAYLQATSFNSKKWNTAIGYFDNYPATIATATSVTKASLALSPDYMGGDDVLRTAFVGLNAAGTVDPSGIVRMSNYIAKQLMASATKINSIDFNGAVVVAGGYDTNIPYYCADPLAVTPTVFPSRTYKRPGVDSIAPIANDQVIVKWYGENVVAVKRGDASAFSISRDNGLTWNDLSLMDSALTSIDDIYVTPDGSKWYVAASDAGEASIYRFDGAWERVLCDLNAPAYMLRAARDDFNAIYAAASAGTAIYFSADAGQTRWYNRTAPGAVTDFAVESKDIVYVGYSSIIQKSTNQGFTWGSPTYPLQAGNVYAVKCIGANNVVVGGTTGFVGYTTDGSATWTKISSPAYTNAANVMATADKLESGGAIFAAGNGDDKVYRYVIGTDTAFNDLLPTEATGYMAYGIELFEGVLYIPTSNGADTIIQRQTWPTVPTPSAVFWSNIDDTTTTLLVANKAPRALKASTGTKLWIINNAAADSIYSYVDTLAATAPGLINPADKALIPLNVQTGAPYNITFTWTRPSLATNYNLWIALDPYLTQLVGVGAGATTFGTGSSTESTLSTVSSWTGYTPGTTYYWCVSAASPIAGKRSETRSFTIQPGTASVPTIGSPANGASNVGVNPAFSWSPSTGATEYEFQLAVSTNFASPLHSEKLTQTGIRPAVKLDPGTTYFWRVRATLPVMGDWSTIANFTVAVEEAAAPPPVEIVQTPPPVIQIPAAPPAQEIVIPPAPAPKEIAPAYIWAIIIIGAVLVIAVIVLIVRTRRSV